MDKMDQRMDIMERKLNDHTEILNKHSTEIGGIKGILKDHSKALLIIEDAVTNKIPALFDKFSTHDNRFERDKNRIEKVEKVTDTIIQIK